MRVVSLSAAVLAMLLYSHEGEAQQITATRVLRLPALQRSALGADPRTRQLALLEAQSALRLRNIAAARLPSISADGQTQYQSDVPSVRLTTANGEPLFSAPKATVDTFLRVDQRIIDPTLDAQAAVERAQLAEQQARVRSTLYGVRQQVNEAFFAAAALQERLMAVSATISELEARLGETSAHVQEGTALSADAATIEALVLQRRLDREELQANRSVALTRLAELTGEAIAEDDTLELPDLATSVAVIRAGTGPVRSRPEYEQFARTRERLSRQQASALAQERPRVSSFARVGYGRPGLNFINDEFDLYAVAGVQLQWKAWTWGSAAREREALALQQQIIAADEEAFTKQLAQSTPGELSTIDRLERALTVDDRIITLREQIERSMQARFREGAVTAADYVGHNTELLQARLARAAHLVELAQTRTQFLTTLGVEVR